MGNCLVTKLKGVVDNDNLPFLNGFTIDVLPDHSSYNIVLKFKRDVTVKSFGGTFSLNGTSGLTQATVPGNTSNTFLFTSGKYKFVIFDKEALDIIECGEDGDKGFSIDMSQFNSNMIDMSAINTKNSYVYGNLRIIPKMLMTTHNPNNDKSILNLDTALINEWMTHYRKAFQTTGNISVFNNCINIQLLDLRSSQVSGEVIDFLNAQVTAGRKSGTMDICINNTNATYNGEPYSPSAHGNKWYIRVTFSEQGYTITYA